MHIRMQVCATFYLCVYTIFVSFFFHNEKYIYTYFMRNTDRIDEREDKKKKKKAAEEEKSLSEPGKGFMYNTKKVGIYLKAQIFIFSLSLFLNRLRN